MAKATIGKGVKTKTTWANALKRDWQLYLLLMIPVALVAGAVSDPLPGRTGVLHG